MSATNAAIKGETRIRPMAAEDISQLVEIERSVSPFPWSAPQFMESLNNHYCRVLESGQQIVGYLVYSVVADVAEILNIAVVPKKQGCGYGKQLLQYVQQQVDDRVQSLFLEVRASNFVAINLYLADGFNQIGERRDYYRTAHGKEDALVMAKEII